MRTSRLVCCECGATIVVHDAVVAMPTVERCDCQSVRARASALRAMVRALRDDERARVRLARQCAWTDRFIARKRKPKAKS